MTRDEILSRYRHLRAINVQHHSAILERLGRQTLLQHARRLGLAHGSMLIAENEEELVLAFDLAIYSAAPGRSRAIDRHARAAPPAPGSDEALVLEAMRRARFSLWRIERRHDVAGVVVTDLLREDETWLLDEGLEASNAAGMVFASRLYDLGDFAITAGVIVPIDEAVMRDVVADERVLRLPDPDRTAEDPRFATAIYRAALDLGVLDGVVLEEPGLRNPALAPT